MKNGAGATFFREQQVRKTDSSRGLLGNIAEEREEEDAIGKSQAQLNPNEPPDTPKDLQQIRPEERKTAPRVSSGKREKTGIRSLKQMYDILRSEETQRKKKRSQSDSSSEPDNPTPSKPTDGRKSTQSKAAIEKDSGSDSDPQDGDLNVCLSF